MAFLGDIGKVFFGGASTKDVVQTGALMSGASLPTAIALGAGAGIIAEDISKAQNKGETTTTQTVQSAQGTIGTGPAQNIEIDFSGRGDMGGIMPAMYRPPSLGMAQMPNPMMQQANVLKFAPAVGGAVAGFVGETIFDFITGSEKKLIITRKLRRDTEKLMELLNNDMDEVARVLTDTKKKAFDSGTVLKILMHKFTNQGPYVTKAAVRKTRKTVRKLETLKRLHADVCGRATPARRAPARRRTSAMAKASC
tara:strand:- start:344 stop:1102 length:759 start_codon:yes stop_codon:yes gene_type:complete